MEVLATQDNMSSEGAPKLVLLTIPSQSWQQAFAVGGRMGIDEWLDKYEDCIVNVWGRVMKSGNPNRC